MTQWFGFSENLKSSVNHDTMNITLRAPDGSHVSFHVEDHTTLNANGVPTVNFSNTKVNC